MGFQGIGAVAIAGTTFTRLIQHHGSMRSTMLTALVPGLSAIGAVWLPGKPRHWSLGAGLLLVTTGILPGVRRPGQRPAAADMAAQRAKSHP